MAECYYDQKVINEGNDAYGVCQKCKVFVCKDCLPQKKRCPHCNSWLSEREDSITKKTFFHGPTRDRLLGF